jgi:hypothetical protein
MRSGNSSLSTVMASEKNIKAAALELGRTFRGEPWFLSVGISEENGRPVLIVYLRKQPPRSKREVLPATWDSIPVRVTVMGRVQPAR